MEHGLILLIEAILALDRKLQKPLGRAVPDLPRLRADPKAFFADEEVAIGPRKPYALATVLGCSLGILVLCLFAVSIADEKPKPGPPDPTPVFVALGSTVVTAVLTTIVLLSWLRGGWMVLRLQGAELGYRGRRVFIPWEFFRASGKPYQPDWRRVILPANPAVPLAALNADGEATAIWMADLKTRSIEACADTQVALRDLYSVRLIELGELLLQLGRRLGGDGPQTAVGYDRSVPIVTADKDGWLQVRLTQLPFPPVCFGCGIGTSEWVNHAIDSANRVTIAVPVCGACQTALSQWRRRGTLVGAAVGIAVALGIGLIATAGNGMGMFLVVAALVALPIVICGGLIGNLIGRTLGNPARFKDYAAGSGTVAMRLNRPEGDAAIRAVLGVSARSAG